MGHPDFRVRNKIFATLSWPDESVGMVKLRPQQQKEFVAEAPKVFAPVKGGWGRQGATHVHLRVATRKGLRRAMEAAWRNQASKHAIKEYEGE